MSIQPIPTPGESSPAVPVTSSGATEPLPVEPPQDGETGEPLGEPAVEVVDPVVQKAQLAEARKQAAGYRTKLRAFEQAALEKANAELPELDRLKAQVADSQARIAELEQRNTVLVLSNEMVQVGARLGLRDPGDALRLIDGKRIEFAEDGQPTNLEDLTRELVKAKPYLAGTPPPPVQPTISATAGTTTGPMPRLTADELVAAEAAGMSPDRYSALKGVKTLNDYQKITAKP